MRTLIVSALALTAMASAALAGPPEAGKTTPSQATTATQAGPVKLTASQMDSVTAAGTRFNIPVVFGSVIGATTQGTACGNQCGSGSIFNGGTLVLGF